MQTTVTKSEDAVGQMDQVADTDGVVAQTNRDRVRSLLLDPLGFRFQRAIDAEAAKKHLNRIADDLAYLSDASLAALREVMRTKGEGSSRNFWPDHASFIGFAEVIQRRPIEDLPALSSWFGSIEGPRAALQGILVETFLFIADRKMPPVNEGARRQVASKAAENARRLQIIAERRAAQMSIDPGELEFERWYRDQQARCEALMHSERAKRGHDDGGVAA